MTRPAAAILAAVYIASIVLANILTNRYGLVPIGLGLSATAGTFAAGLTLIARNFTQSAVGRLVVIALMAVGILLSWWLASAALAGASAAAFALSETADMAVYTPLKNRGWKRAAFAACIVGAIVDTYAFLSIAGFPLTRDTIAGQLLVKIGVSGLVLLAALVFRAPEPEPAT